MTLSRIMHHLHDTHAKDARTHARTAMMIWILGLPDPMQARAKASDFLRDLDYGQCRSDAARQFILLLKDIAHTPTPTHPTRRKHRLH